MSSMVIWQCPDTGVEAAWHKGETFSVYVPRQHDSLPCISRGHAITKAKRWARKLRRQHMIDANCSTS